MEQAEDEFMHPEKLLGCDPVKYLENIKTDIQQFVLPIAKFVDNTEIGTGVTKVVGGSLGIVGGGLTVGGIAAAPFTLGISLILTFTGLGISIGGTAAASTAAITKMVLDKRKKNQSKEAFDNICEKTNNFVDIIKKYDEAFKAGYKYFSTEKGKKRLKDWIKYFKLGVSSPLSVGLTTGKIVTVAVTVFRLMEAVEVPAVQISIEAIWSEIAIGGRVLVTAGSKLAVIVASAGAALSIGVGIWDCVSGAKDIKLGLKSKKKGTSSNDKRIDNDEEKERLSKSTENLQLIVKAEEQAPIDEEVEKDSKQQVKRIADEIRQNAKEMEDHIDKILAAYLEIRADVEAQIVKIQTDHKTSYFEKSIKEPLMLCIDSK